MVQVRGQDWEPETSDNGTVEEPEAMGASDGPGAWATTATTVHDRIPFDPTGPPHPDDPTLLRFTQFDGYLKSFRMDPNSGEMILQLSVPADEKRKAFEMTDHMLIKYRFDVYKAPKRSRRRKPETNGNE